MTIKRSELEVAFLQRDLRDASSFIKHCEEHGIKVSKEELEYYDEQNLILPALLLDRGYTELFKFLPKGGSEWKTAYRVDQPKIKYQKLDPQRYYASIGLSMGKDGWLDHYPKEDKKMPARQKYVPWDTFTSWKWEVTDPKLVENGIEPLYSFQQLYPVAFITKNLQVSFKNRYLFRDAKSWAKTGGQVSAFMDELVDKTIRPRMAEYCVLINVLADIKKLVGPINLTIHEIYNDTLKLHGDEANAAKEAKDERDFLFESKSGEAKAILAKHSLTADRLSDMRTMLLEAGTFDLGWHAKKRREAYLKTIDDDDLSTAEDPYRDVAFINNLLTMIGEKPRTVKQLLLNTDYNVCQVCSFRFAADRRTRKTCGRPACIKEYNRKYKQQKRAKVPGYGS